MQCFVYKSLRRAETYVYLRAADAFDVLPGPIAEHLGALAFVIEIELSSRRKLARENVDEVMVNLDVQGYHLQFPPSAPADATA
ncbi:MAG: YcgL domain-containing protein [Xanthomonadales bacterium]|uniref:YcgL domain-containing protein n=1 Tax=Dokdonella sp. TaxID=2291710 RepID=UPI002C2453B8|nr:YcgL domain-containing protein [Xanthomonadales bacterium]HQV72322.1 YcgL domain-containing protein [Dokdonella sp.]MBK7012946.1 YcgL domain-containing protein [Xanthomonadales bacterium]MBK7210196.1 YcgL domain-containing protein [Xanthomonadales bacterium]MBL0223645.1 YcgL domain-containing protein [Xanthomonadales bacterium]